MKQRGESFKTQDWIPECLAGAGIGLFLGLLVGLSISEVVGYVVSGLAALFAAILGLKDIVKINPLSKNSPQPLPPNSQQRWRLAAFGFVGALAVLAGIFMRTHNTLGPSPKDISEQWQEVSFDEKQAAVIAAYQLLGLLPEGSGFEEIEGAGGAILPSMTGTALFSIVEVGNCADLEPKPGVPIEQTLNNYMIFGPPWSLFAVAMEGLPADYQMKGLRGAWEKFCLSQENGEGQ